MFDYPMEPLSIKLFLIFLGLEVVFQFFERRYPSKWDPSLEEDTAQQQHAQERPAYVSPRITSNESRNNDTLQFAKRNNTGASSPAELALRKLCAPGEARREARADAKEALRALCEAHADIEEALRELREARAHIEKALREICA